MKSTKKISVAGAMLFCALSMDALAQAGINLNGGSITNVAPGVDPDDAVIKSQLDDETAARINGDIREQNARVAAVNQLTVLLSQEADSRILGDELLTQRIIELGTGSEQIDARFDSEAIARTAGLAAEAEARQMAIANEAQERVDTDRQLLAGVVLEREAREAGEVAIRQRIAEETDARLGADAAEMSARMASDLALGGRIDDERRERIAADNMLRQEIASSTATAIALGGAVVLPDLDFTLSGNVSTYQGAQAVAINGSARVGSNTYVTSAVGGGLNKRGSVGARVGFVIGF